jgi:hypothetical protein
MVSADSPGLYTVVCSVLIFNIYISGSFGFDDSDQSFEDHFGDLDLDSFFDSNNTDDNLGNLLDSFTKDFGQGEEVSHPIFYTLVFVYGIVITIGLVGNIVILYAILSKRVMWTARNYFILCLAFSDLLLCAFTMPLTLWEVLRKVISQAVHIPIFIMVSRGQIIVSIEASLYYLYTTVGYVDILYIYRYTKNNFFCC